MSKIQSDKLGQQYDNNQTLTMIILRLFSRGHAVIPTQAGIHSLPRRQC
jgi:hypothetical protein